MQDFMKFDWRTWNYYLGLTLMTVIGVWYGGMLLYSYLVR